MTGTVTAFDTRTGRSAGRRNSAVSSATPQSPMAWSTPSVTATTRSVRARRGDRRATVELPGRQRDRRWHRRQRRCRLRRHGLRRHLRHRRHRPRRGSRGLVTCHIGKRRSGDRRDRGNERGDRGERGDRSCDQRPVRRSKTSGSRPVVRTAWCSRPRWRSTPRASYGSPTPATTGSRSSPPTASSSRRGAAEATATANSSWSAATATATAQSPSPPTAASTSSTWATSVCRSSPPTGRS